MGSRRYAIDQQLKVNERHGTITMAPELIVHVVQALRQYVDPELSMTRQRAMISQLAKANRVVLHFGEPPDAD